jgi:hypothetical protein
MIKPKADRRGIRAGWALPLPGSHLALEGVPSVWASWPARYSPVGPLCSQRLPRGPCSPLLVAAQQYVYVVATGGLPSPG